MKFQMKIKKILNLILITIMLTACGKEKMNIKISDDKSDFRVEEKEKYIEITYQDKVFNLSNYEGTTKELVIIPGCTMDEDYVSVTLLTSDNLYFIMLDDEDISSDEKDFNFTLISDSKNITKLDYNKDIERTNENLLYCFRNVEIDYINGSKKTILMSYDDDIKKIYNLVSFN